MKRVTVLVAAMVLISAASFGWGKNPPVDFKIISVKKHVLHFKVNRAFVGGKLELFDAYHHLLETDDLPHKQTIVYFDELPAGDYVIVVRKDNKSFEINHRNR